MKKMLPLTCLLFLLGAKNHAQTGFSIVYEMEVPGSSFHNIALREDTLVIAGTLFVDSLNQWGGALIFMDTFGNLLKSTIYTDTSTNGFVFRDHNSIINTIDGGYAMVGKLLFEKAGILLKFDGQGNIEFAKELSDTTVRYMDLRYILEVSDGFVLAGYKQMTNYMIKTFVIKISSSGELIWEKKYGDESLNNFIYSIIKIDDNTIVIGIGKYTEFISPYTPANEWTKSWIFAIDSIGNLKWDWESALNEGTYVAGLQAMPDGGFMYASASFQIHDPWEWGSRPKIVRRDSNFSLLWERDVCLSSAPNNIIYDLKPTPDGHFIAVGSWVLPDYPPEPPGAWKGGCLYKISSGGDSIWTYCDTVPNTIEALGGVVVLSSGSIVAAGNVTRS